MITMGLNWHHKNISNKITKNFGSHPTWFLAQLIMNPPIHTGNTLLVDDMSYKSMFNEPYSAIILEFFDGLCGENHYFLETIFPYLESLHFSQDSVFECSHVNRNQK
jgi:hypothetical protein